MYIMVSEFRLLTRAPMTAMAVIDRPMIDICIGVGNLGGWTTGYGRPSGAVSAAATGPARAATRNSPHAARYVMSCSGGGGCGRSTC
jgi:hypothetical protein